VFHPVHRPSPSPQAPPTISYVGRLSPEKELDLLLASWDEVHARTGARLRLVGRGRHEAASSASPPVAQRQRRAVPGSTARRRSVLATSDVVVLTSGTETFSLATAEALACGTPVVGPARGAVGEMVVASGGGLAFTAGSAPALGHALRTLLSLSAEAPPRRRPERGASTCCATSPGIASATPGGGLRRRARGTRAAQGQPPPPRGRNDAAADVDPRAAAADAGVTDEPMAQRRAS